MKEKKSKGKLLAEDAVSEVYFWGKTLSVALIVLILCNTFFLRISTVSGDSMNPTLRNMDQLILQISGYNTDTNPPARGDIVVLVTDEFGRNRPLVKRIIGVAGDVIDITTDGYISINGVVQTEEYISEPISPSERGTVSYPYTVSEGHIFVIGDNRNFSYDSRNLGEVSCSDVIGKAIFRIWPLNHLGGVK